MKRVAADVPQPLLDTFNRVDFQAIPDWLLQQILTRLDSYVKDNFPQKGKNNTIAVAKLIAKAGASNFFR